MTTALPPSRAFGMVAFGPLLSIAIDADDRHPSL
jgi:hypothetical protein